ncbi:hematopoietic lineage cell-specific protein-like, partial [Huso huso]
MCPNEKRSPPLYGHSANVLVPEASGTRGAARSLTGGSKCANRFDSAQQFLSFGQTAIDTTMWKSVVGHNVSVKVEAEGDDWDTDPDFVNDVSEQEQRWGAKTIEGSGAASTSVCTSYGSTCRRSTRRRRRRSWRRGPRPRTDTGASLGWRRTAWTRLPWATAMWRRWTSTPLRPTRPKASEGSTGYRRIALTSLPSALNTRGRWSSTPRRKVRNC